MMTAPDALPVIGARNLEVRYGPIRALHDVTFDLEAGRTVALVGGNGAGKSTLMKRMVGLAPAGSGDILWHGVPMTGRTREMAYLPQRADIDWRFPLTVRGLVEMGRYGLLGPFRPFGPADRDAVEDALARMDLARLAGRQIGALSGGQQQRTLIARALAQEARVLLLDEPFTGLDEPSRAALADRMRALASSGRLVVASHHDVKTAGTLFDEVLLINGTVIAHGPAQEVLTGPNLAQAFGEAE